MKGVETAKATLQRGCRRLLGKEQTLKFSTFFLASPTASEASGDHGRLVTVVAQPSQD